MGSSYRTSQHISIGENDDAELCGGGNGRYCLQGVITVSLELSFLAFLLFS